MDKIEQELENEDALELEEPKLYKVMLLNDDYTSMDFVVDILINIFHHDVQKANATMFKIHEEGLGLCGVYTHEIAETKVAQVHSLAKEHQFPLRATIQEE